MKLALTFALIGSLASALSFTGQEVGQPSSSRSLTNGQPAKDEAKPAEATVATRPLVDRSPERAIDLEEFRLDDWERLLRSRVRDDGCVDYKGWKADSKDRSALKEFLMRAGRVDAPTVSTERSSSVKRAAILAFWINVYNAAAIEAILQTRFDLDPNDPSMKNFDMFRRLGVHSGDRLISLRALEHEILRPMNEPRVHFALVCGAKGCPKLRREAWSADKLESQLDENGREYLGRPTSFSLDDDGETARVTPYLLWFADDFGSNDRARIDAIRPLLPSKIAERINGKNLKLSYQGYDWALNLADDGLEPHENKPAEEKMKPEADGKAIIYPKSLEAFLKDEKNLADGLIESEKLRKRLLALDPLVSKPKLSAVSVDNLDRTPDATTNNDAAFLIVDRFGRAAKAFLTFAESGMKDAEPLTEFKATGALMLNQFQGGKSFKPTEAFKAFDGKWFGLWDVWPMNHDWRPTVSFQPPRKVSENQPSLVGLQYAWIGGGFGWNYLCSIDGDPNKHVVLGMVYYLKEPELTEITGGKAHVGYVDGPTRIIWLTDREIFFEEAFSARGDKPERYAITGVYHDLLGDRPSISGEVVQAVYTRKPDVRPKFKKYRWKPPEEFTSATRAVPER